MKINVEMTEAEYEEFVEARKQRTAVAQLQNRIEQISYHALKAIGPKTAEDSENPRFKILDHFEAEDLWLLCGGEYTEVENET